MTEKSLDLGNDTGNRDGRLSNSDVEDNDLPPSRLEIVCRAIKAVQENLSHVNIKPLEPKPIPYGMHKVFEYLPGVEPHRETFSLASDQSTPELIFRPLEAKLASGRMEKRFFSDTYPTVAKSPIPKCPASVYPGVSSAPKMMSQFTVPKEDESHFLRDQEQIIGKLATLQQQNQMLLPTMSTIIHRDPTLWRTQKSPTS